MESNKDDYGDYIFTQVSKFCGEIANTTVKWIDIGCIICGRSFPDRETGAQEYIEHFEKYGCKSDGTTNDSSRA